MDRKQIDRKELDNYIEQEPDCADERDEAEEYYRFLNEQITDAYSGPVKPYSNFQCWLRDLYGIFWNARRLLWIKCPDPDCKTPERVLWFNTGKHTDCIPF